MTYTQKDINQMKEALGQNNKCLGGDYYFTDKE